MVFTCVRSLHALKGTHRRTMNFNEHLKTDLPLSFRVSYVGSLEPGSTAEYRVRALQRLGQQVQIFDCIPHLKGSRLMQAIRFRYPIGPLIAEINRALWQHVRETQPEIVFLDKPIYFTPQTIERIKATGAKIVIYMQDNPFGPRNDGCWHQFYRVYPLADLLCAIRETDVVRYRSWSLPYVRIMLSYEPSVHFSPPEGWNDSNRNREVSYIGYPYEDRPAFLVALGEKYDLPVSISGSKWESILTAEQKQKFFTGGYLAGSAYRETIWRSKINLSFVTQLNEEDIAHKSVEICASGGFLLALRTPGHQACFEEDREAVFFSSVEECAEKAAYYLSHVEEREAIAQRGYERTIAGGYSNDTQLAKVLNYFLQSGPG